MWLIFGIWDGSSIQKSFFMIKSLIVFRQNSSESVTVLSIHIVCIPTCTYQRWVSYFGALVPFCFGYRAHIQPSNAILPTGMHALDSSGALCICERAALLCGTLAKKDRFLLDSSVMNQFRFLRNFLSLDVLSVRQIP